MRYLYLFFCLVFFSTCINGNEMGALDPCQEAQRLVSVCLSDYCDTEDDPACQNMETAHTSLFGNTASFCQEMTAAEIDTLLGAECDAIIQKTFESLSGKSDAPCPAYFPWCQTNSLQNKGYAVKVLSYSLDRIELEIVIQDVQVREIRKDGVIYHKLEIEGNGTTAEVGNPAIPVISLLLGVPPAVNAATIRRFQKLEVATFEKISPYPYQRLTTEKEASPAFAINPAAYSTETPYPASDLEMDPLAIWRNYKALRVKLHPVHYEASTQKLKVIKRFKVELDFHSTETNDSEVIDQGETTFAGTYRTAMINYKELAREFQPPQNDNPDRVRYLIITPPAFAETIKPLAQLKDSQGLKTRVTLLTDIIAQKSTEKNGDATKIKDYIKSVYLEQGIEFVLLVGDIEDIPMYIYEAETYQPPYDSYDPIYSDYWYSLLAGDDLLPEIALGRLTGKNPEEIQVQVDKTLNYSTGDPEAAWRQKVLLVAHEQSAPNKYMGCSESIRKVAYKDPAGFMKLYGSEKATNQNVVDIMNQGVGIINYRGHGDVTYWSEWNGRDNFTFSELTVTNKTMTPVVFSIACLNSKLNATEETLAEQMVKRKDGGAVAFLGATQPSNTEPNHDFDRFLFKAILDQGLKLIGQISNYANIELLNKWGDDPLALDNVKMYLWLGDPALRVSMGNPPKTPVTVTWCNLQWPQEVTDTADIPETDIFSQIWTDGFTNLPGPAPYLRVQIGYGPLETMPDSGDWVWSNAFYNQDVGNNDEYMSRLNISEPGQYAYAFRISGDGGSSYTYCDKDGNSNGISVNQLGRITIQPRPEMSIQQANIGYPNEVTVSPGKKTEKIWSYLTINGSINENLIPFVKAEVGYGPISTLPTDVGWIFSPAKFEEKGWSNDIRYSATLQIDPVGEYQFSFRFSPDDGKTWTYADKDGSLNGVTVEQLGKIKVAEPPGNSPQ